MNLWWHPFCCLCFCLLAFHHHAQRFRVFVYRQLINVYSSSRTKSGCGHFILVLFILLSFGYYQLDCVLKLLSFKCSFPFCIETCGKSLFLISVYRNDDEFGVSLERKFHCQYLFKSFRVATFQGWWLQYIIYHRKIL